MNSFPPSIRMPIDLSIGQVLLFAESTGPRVVAKSAGFPFVWEEAARLAAVRYGTKPADATPSTAIFALPVGTLHAAVVHVAEQPSGTLGFRFLLLNRPLYEAIGDPFAIADTFPHNWFARGELPTLAWIPEPLPPSKVEAIQELLKTGDGPFLLGSTQSLLDGGRICLKHSDASEATLRTIWQLLPTRSRSELWPATLAFSDELGFDIWAMPEPPAKLPAGCLTEEQAKDYPEGRYELAMQIAVESNNQSELDRLLARRSSQETLRLAALMLAFAVVVAVGVKVMTWL